MESINIITGYNKVNHHPIEIQSPPSPSKKTTAKKRHLTITISAIVLFTIIIGVITAVLIHRHHHHSKPKPQQPPSSSSSPISSSIKAVCSVTRYPDSCFDSITSLNTSTTPDDPEIIFKLSLQVSVNEVSNISSLLKKLNELHSEGAISDCMSQFEDALGRLNDSVSEMEVSLPDGEKMLSDRKISDIQTWISGAMTDQETCLDGLEEMGSTVVDQVKTKMHKSNEFLSNNLAIIANLQTLLDKFHLILH